MHWETKRKIMQLTLLRWFGTKPAISPRYVCTNNSWNKIHKRPQANVRNRKENVHVNKEI